MSDGRPTTSLGALLDRTRWDYAPRDRARTDLLSPAGSLFSGVPWDQSDPASRSAAAALDPSHDEGDQDLVTTLR